MFENFVLKRMLVDNVSAVNLLIFKVYIALGLSPNKLHPVCTPLIGLRGKQVPIEGAVDLIVELRYKEYVKKFKKWG